MTATDDNARPPATGAGFVPSTLPEILQWREQNSPDARFIVTPDRVERTYAEVCRAARGLAGELVDHDVQPGAIIGFYLPNSPAWVVGSFAVWKLRCAVAACGTLLPVSEILEPLRLAKVRTVVTNIPSDELQNDFDVITVSEDGIVDGATGLPRLSDPLSPICTVSPTDLATITFSSGTTGTPKGIPSEHRNFVVNAQQQAAGWARSPAFRQTAAPADVPPHLIFSPFGHGSVYGQLSLRMWLGRPVLLVHKFNVEVAAELIRSYRPPALQLSPAMIHMLAVADEPCDLSSLEYVSSTNASLSEKTRRLFEGRYNVPILQAYGLSEAGVVSIDQASDLRAGLLRRPGSSGKAAKGVEIKILSDGKEVAAGVEGEIVVKTPSIRAQHLGQAESAIVDGWLQTGDIGHLDEEGYLYITGRTFDKLVVGGLNVYPPEVEEAIRESPLVHDAIVVGLPDDRLGDWPVAGVVWDGEEQPHVLLEQLRGRLAHYKVPRAVFSIESVPLTARGKVDRRAGRELAVRALGRPVAAPSPAAPAPG